MKNITYALLLLLVLAKTALADTLQYDQVGNIINRTTSGGTSTYAYDALNRLISEAGPAKTQTLSYDANGNRLTDGSGSYTYSVTSNRMATRHGVAVAFDPAGNMTTDGLGHTFTYNQAGRLYQVYSGSTLLASYYYDYKGQRTRKVTTSAAPQGAGTTIYHYDEWHHLIAETTGTGAALHTYVWRDDTPVAQIDYVPSRRIIYLEADQNNTPRVGRDQNGAIIWQWQSDAFGTTAPTASTGVTVNLRFPGQYFDIESGLDYNLFRDYDAKAGRYVESDPIGLAGGSYSTYTYVGGNPVSNVDPYGLDTYVTNRDLSALGTSARSWADPLTHTFTFSTNPDGSIAATYSWGNAANLQGWNLNQPEDIKAAQQALQNGDAQQVAPSFVDPYYRKAFDQLNKPANNHANGVLTNNCKTETVKLNDLAWKLLSGGK